MGWIKNPKEAAKNKAKEVARNATHANCYRCGEEGLKVAMVHENSWGTSERWRCRNKKACDKRREANGVEGQIRHRRTSKSYRKMQGWEG